MTRVVIEIKGSTKTVDLPEALLTFDSDPHLLVKKATIFWDYVNVETGVNDKIRYNNSNHIFGQGYYTFKMIVDALKELGAIELVANKHDLTCTLTSDHRLELFKFGELLGFNENEAVTTKKVSPNVVDINKGLRYIRIGCSIVKRPENIVDGTASDIIVELPITSTQPLKSSVQRLPDIESKVSINKGAFNQMIFDVTDQDGDSIDVGSVLLEIRLML